MRQIAERLVWLGGRGALADLSQIFAHQVRAIVDLAAEEPVVVVPRDLVYCRFPLVDGASNPAWAISGAIACVEGFIRACVPVLVCCSAGGSRSPCIAAGAIARAEEHEFDEAIAEIRASGPLNVSTLLYQEVRSVARAMDRRPLDDRFIRQPE